MNETLVLAAIVITLACANTVVSLRVAISQLFERRQVIAQIILIWLFPIIGFLLIGLFLKNEERPASPIAIGVIDTDEKGNMLDSPLTGHQNHD